MRNPIMIFLYLLLFHVSTLGQNTFLDSLETQYQNTEGKEKLNIALSLILEYRSINEVKTNSYLEEAKSYIQTYPDFSKDQRIYFYGSFLAQEANWLALKNQLEDALKLYQENVRVSGLVGEEFKNKMLGNAYKGMAKIYRLQNAHEASLKYLLKSEEAYLAGGIPFNAATAQVEISSYYERLRDWDNALAYINKAFTNCDKEKYPYFFRTLISYKTGIFNSSEQYDSTLAILTPTYLENAKNYGSTIYYTSLLMEAEALAWKGQEERVNRILAEVKQGISPANRDLWPDYLYTNMLAKALLKNYEEAYFAQSTYKKYVDSIVQVRAEQNLLELQTKYETEAKNTQILALEKETIYHQKLLIGGGGLLLLLLISGFLFFKNILQKRKTEEALAVKEKEVIVTKERLFTNITHELRTPLSLIISPLQELSKRNYDEDSQKKVELALNNSQQLLGLVNQILDWHSLEANILQNTPTVGEAKGIIQKNVLRFLPKAKEKNIDLTVDLPMEELLGKLDFDKLEKVLNNIISNAIKYSSDGGKVEVSASFKNQELNLTVKDNGNGIASKEQMRIFERFNRSPTTDSEEGYGIGLALVKELTVLMNGTINLHSKEGKGTQVELIFPFEKIENQNNLSISENDKLTVFVIEDNLPLRNYIVDFISKEYEVEAFGSAELADERMKEMHPDILLLDMMLPGMDGIEYCKQIKNNEETSHLPVMLLTAKLSERNKLLALKSGADVWMSKPFEVSEVLIQLSNLIQVRKKLQEKYDKEIRISFEKNKLEVDNSFLEKTLNCILENLSDEKLNVTNLANKLGISRFQLAKKIKSLTNKTTVQFIREVRLEKARTLLQEGEKSISEVAYQVGFKDPNYFSICFKEYVGVTPTEWKREQVA